MSDDVEDGEAMTHVEGVDVTGMVGSRAARRAREHASAQHCIRAMVDFLAATANASELPRRLGEIAGTIVSRADAIRAARQFLSDCGADE